MSEIEELMKLISGVLQGENKVLRTNSQSMLKSLRDTKPNQLLAAYLTILESPMETPLRNFSASQLRLSLSSASPINYSNLWTKLEPALQQQIKVKLFQILYKEPQLTMKKYIASILGQIAGSILGMKDEQWPEFKPHIWILFKDPDVSANLAAFTTLESFLAYMPSHFQGNFNELYALFKAGITHDNNQLKLATLKCIAQYISVISATELKTMEELIIPILQAVYCIQTNENDQNSLQALSQMMDAEPKFFRRKFKELFQLLSSLFKSDKLQPSVKRMITEMLVDYAQCSPIMFRKKIILLQGIIEMVFFHMVSIKNEISKEWMVPPQGYNQDDQDEDDFQTTRFGMGAIDRLIESIGQEQTLPILSKAILKLIAYDDWRYKYTALMVLSQIGEYIQQIQKIQSVKTLIASFLGNQNPMLRYAACHAIGQISDDMQPQFQQAYGNELYPIFVQLLSDGVPRVVAHSAACLTNFAQGLTLQQLSPLLDVMMHKLLSNCSSNVSLVVESSMGAISTVVEVTKEHFEKYLPNTVALLFEMFQSPKYTTKEYRRLKAQALETLTIIAEWVGPQLFAFAAPKTIDLLIMYQNSKNEQLDPPKTAVMNGWQRVCKAYGRELESQLGRILPSLFSLVESVIDKELNPIEKEEEEQEQNANTFENQQAETAISMLNVFIEELKELYIPYVERTVVLLSKIIKEHLNEDVKEEACLCLPNIIKAVKIGNAASAVVMAKHFIGIIVQLVQKQFDTDLMICELETLKEIIDEINTAFLNQLQMQQFSRKIIQFLQNSEKNKGLSKNFAAGQQADEDEQQLITEQIKHEEQFQVSIAQLIGSLFKTHGSQTMDLANYLITSILPSVFVNDQSENLLKFGTFLIVDMVQFLGYQLLRDNWSKFFAVLEKYMTHPNCSVRQSVCYGAGIFAVRTPKEVLNKETVEHQLTNLIEVLKIGKGKGKDKSYQHCRDNVVAAIGKIIKAHGNFIDLPAYVAMWSMCLPLKHDKEELLEQHAFYSEIMLKQPDLILGSDRVQGIVRVFKTYSEIVGNSKLYDEQTAANIRQYVQQIQQDAFYAPKMGDIQQQLTEIQRINLINFMKKT